MGCKTQTPEEKSLENCEKHIRKEQNINDDIKLLRTEVSSVRDIKLDISPYENAVYTVLIEFDTEDEYKKFGDCLCDEEGNVIPRNPALEKEMEQKAESENQN